DYYCTLYMASLIWVF
nr:immunoglobulin light chain junction region [Macaca mulatta]